MPVTGKTTLARHIADGVDGECTLLRRFTGKAAPGDAQQGLRQRLDHHSLITARANSGRGGAECFELWDDAPAVEGK